MQEFSAFPSGGDKEPGMPKGPQGQKRPADTIGAAVTVAKIATGEIEETPPSGKRKGGLVGDVKRAEALTPEERSEIASRGANARWDSPPRHI